MDDVITVIYIINPSNSLLIIICYLFLDLAPNCFITLVVPTPAQSVNVAFLNDNASGYIAHLRTSVHAWHVVRIAGASLPLVPM